MKSIDLGFDKILNNLKDLDGKIVEFGILEEQGSNKAQNNRKGSKKGVLNWAQVAYLNEFGANWTYQTSGKYSLTGKDGETKWYSFKAGYKVVLPDRQFFRPIFKRGKDLKKFLIMGLNKAIDKNGNANMALDTVGEKLSNLVKHNITNGKGYAKLSEKQTLFKGRSKQLTNLHWLINHKIRG